VALHLLSPREVQTLPNGMHADGEGLYLRVRGPHAAWMFRFTGLDGSRRFMGLGAAHRDSLAAAGESLTRARDKARRARDALAAGLDPIEQKRADRRAAMERKAAERSDREAQELTLCRVARAYHEQVIEPKWTDRHGKLWIASLENNIPPGLWHKRIDAIGHVELLEALVALRLRIPETSDKITQRLSAVFDHALFFGQCAGNPVKILRRKLSEAPRGRKEDHYRAMPFAEVPAVVAELRKLYATAARALEFTILTASRTGESLGATWKEIDETAAIWRVPAARMKAREEHVVPLVPRAMEILAQMRERQGGEFVFPSPVDRMRGLSNMAMLTVLNRIGIRERTTVHGFRAAFSTWAYEAMGAREEIVECCLAHRETDRVKAAYDRSQHHAARRKLLTAWADFVGGRTLPANVVEADFRASRPDPGGQPVGRSERM
jgi:integrase